MSDSTARHQGKFRRLVLNENELLEVQRILKQFVGLRLTQMVRDVGFQRFGFGNPTMQLNRRGEQVESVSFAIVANCPWCLTGPNEFELNSNHFEPERRDDHAKAFYSALSRKDLTVESVVVDALGKIQIELSNVFKLTLSPGDFQPINPESFEAEHWRIITPDDESGGTAVLRFSGLELWSVDP